MKKRAGDMWVTSEQVKIKKRADTSGQILSGWKIKKWQEETIQNDGKTWKVGHDENTYMVACKSLTRTNQNDGQKQREKALLPCELTGLDLTHENKLHVHLSRVE